MPNDLSPSTAPAAHVDMPDTNYTVVIPDVPVLFSPLGPRAQTILLISGAYRPAPLYERDGMLYAKVGTTFIKLLGHGATTRRTTYWKELHGVYSIARHLTINGAPLQEIVS